MNKAVGSIEPAGEEGLCEKIPLRGKTRTKPVNPVTYPNQSATHFGRNLLTFVSREKYFHRQRFSERSNKIV
jgi:hypothetical protein